MEKLIFLRETWTHMSPVSGFDPLFAELATKNNIAGEILMRDITVPELNLIQQIATKFGIQPKWDKKTQGESPSPFVLKQHEIAGLSIIELAKMHPDAKIILSAAENEYGFVLSNADPAIRKRMVLCFHQPPSWHRLHWRNTGALDDLCGIVCLGQEQQEYFASVTHTPTILINHGVNLDFFCPPCSEQTRYGNRLLFVGQWLRDLEVLKNSMMIIWQSRPDIELDCVVPYNARNSKDLIVLAKDPRVSWHAGISEKQLLHLYQNAALMFLPLIDAVANNAIVESLACGLPVITTQVGSIREEYPTSIMGCCSPNGANDHAETVLDWLSKPQKRHMAAVVAREYAASHCCWSKIATKLVNNIKKHTA